MRKKAKILTVETYTPDHMEMIYEAKKELEKGIRPELKGYPNISGYDTIFIGFPNWWNTMPMPVLGFLEHYDWSGKRIIPFVTSGGGGFGKSIDDMKKICTGAGYFDYYLLHALQAGNYKTYDKYHIWDFVKEQKAKGLIKHWGFSFHATPDILDELLTDHPDVEFVQLQLNYADWENPQVTSRENYEVARKHGKSIVVMEPVKGGALANPPKEVGKIFKGTSPDASYASWAIRYAASLDGIITVLSCMSNLEQMKDNLSYMKDFKPLNAEEQAAIRKAQELMNGIRAIPCTACHYCTAGCPKKIAIPEIFAARNQQLVWG